LPPAIVADNELGALLKGLEGDVIPGGDPIRNPDVLPTGKNIHALINSQQLLYFQPKLWWIGSWIVNG